MHSSLSSKIQRFIRDARLLRSGDRVVLAVSGGADSMAMLGLFSELSKKLRLALIVAHVHHGLRGAEADADERCVRMFAELQGIPYRRVRVDVLEFRRRTGSSVEASARILRYRALERIRLRDRADVIATAHHADDQAETVFLRASRGADVKGLAGILPRLASPPVIRPMLPATHSELVAYAQRQGIPYREDSTNRDLRFRRNAARFRDLPLAGRMLKINPADALPRLARSAGRLDVLLDDSIGAIAVPLVRKEDEHTWTLDIDPVRTFPEGMRSRVVSDFLRKSGIEPTRERVNRCSELLSLQTGKILWYRGANVRIVRDRKTLVAQNGLVRKFRPATVRPGQEVSVGQFRLKVGTPRRVPASMQEDPAIAWVDASLLVAPLRVRSWRTGDWFIPIGMSGRKKLSDYLTESKVPAHKKDMVPVVTSGSAIVWVCGMRPDERFKITPATRAALQFTFTSNV